MIKKSIKVITNYDFSMLRRQNFFLIFMLMAIFLRPDVGWGQICQNCTINLVQNPTLDPITTLSYQMQGAFSANKVEHWNSFLGTPHVAIFNENGPPNGCNTFGYVANSLPIPKNCIVATKSNIGEECEGIYTTIPFLNSSFLTYKVFISGKVISCGEIVNLDNVDVYLRASNDDTQYYGFQPDFNAPGTDHEEISDFGVSGFYTQFEHCFEYVPSKNFQFLQIYPHLPPQIVVPENQYYVNTIITLDDVKVTCKTTALSTIVLNQVGNNIMPEGMNDSNIFTFEKYYWDFGDGNTSNLVKPSHTYQENGTYTVCLNIEDSNGCCSEKICEDVVVDCPIISADFTYSDECPKYSFTPTNPQVEYSYHWSFGDGSTSLLQNPTKVYSANGTYTVCLTITDEDGCTESFCQNIVVTCSAPWSCTPMPGFDYIYIDASPSRDISDFFPLINSLNGERLIIRGKLIIDKDFSIRNSPHILLEPGAEIYVPIGKKILFNYNTLVEACTQMWKGITVNGIGYFTGNGIKDAIHALNLKNGSTCYLSSNNFVENLIGIYASEPGGAVNIMQFTKNEFRSTNSLRPPYSGYLVEWPDYNVFFDSENNNTWAGIVLNNQSGIANLEGRLGLGNRFEGIRNAVLATNSNFKLRYAEISNLAGNQLYHPISGHGVKGTKCTEVLVNNVIISNSFRAILVNNEYQSTTSVTVENCTFTDINPNEADLGHTIDIIYCRGGKYNVKNNIFTDANLPITFHDVKDFNELNITKNGTQGIPITYGGWAGYGINISDSKSRVSYAKLEDNFLFTDKNNYGIGVFESTKIALSRNNISISGTNGDIYSGIFITNSSGCELRNNIVTLNTPENNVDATGIKIIESPNTLFCCNSITGAYNNLEFTGTCTNTRLKQTTMASSSNAGFGLYLDNANIGKQFKSFFGSTRAFGNIWIGNKIAKADGQFLPNLFRVDGGDDNSIGIANSTFLPMAMPSAWFQPSLASTPLCSNTPLCDEPVMNGNGPWIVGDQEATLDLENAIIGVNGNIPYLEQELWIAQNFAYDYISDNPQLLANSTPLTTFYSSPSAPILAYQSIEENIDNMFALTPTEQITWNTSNAASTVAIEALEAINALVTETNIDSLYPIMLPYMAAISYHNGILNDINDDVNDRALINATNIRAQIVSMPGSQSFLAQYKLIRIIYMDYIIHGKAYVIATYLPQINEIASRCYLIYGESVTLARIMQATLGVAVAREEGSCVPVIPKSKISNEIAVYNVVPNPSSDDWTANIDGISLATNINYTLTDLQGRIVANNSSAVHPDQAFTISGAALAPGVYILNLVVGDIKMTPRRLIKIQ